MKIRLWLEWSAIFIIMPIGIMMIDDRRVIFGLLWGAAFLGGVALWRQNRTEFFTMPTWQQMKTALFILLPVMFFLLLSAYFLVPDRFLALPLHNPALFAMIALLYPCFSALPQEILYRGFFFDRYKTIIPDRRVMIVLSAFAFALAHLVFGNLVALGLGFAGGLLFAISYARTRSIPLVVIEHALYGLIVFASGWGWYFYLGAGHRFGG